MATRRKDRKQGKYRVRIRVGDIQYDKSFTLKEDADRYEAKLMRERELIRAGLGAPQEQILIYDYAQTWLKKRAKLVEKRAITQPTYEGDEKNLRRHILPYMAKRPMQTVTTPEWTALIGFIEEKHSLADGTCNRVRSTLHTMYMDSIVDGVGVINPITAVPRRSEKKKKRKKKFWETEEECLLYLEFAPSEGRGFDMAANILINTGLRESETVVIQVKDVDLDHKLRGGTIRVHRIYEQSTNKIVARTKSGDGQERYIPITEELYEKIVSHLCSTSNIAPDDYLVCEDDGSLIHPDRILDMHYRVCARAKLKRITVHEIRTTFASMYRAKGGRKDDLQDILGHGSAIVTDIYALQTKEGMKSKAVKGVGVKTVAAVNVVKFRGKK